MRCMLVSCPLIHPCLLLMCGPSWALFCAVTSTVYQLDDADQQQHAAMVNDFLNATHWPKHLLVHYTWHTRHEEDEEAGLLVLFSGEWGINWFATFVQPLCNLCLCQPVQALHHSLHCPQPTLIRPPLTYTGRSGCCGGAAAGLERRPHVSGEAAAVSGGCDGRPAHGWRPGEG